MIKKCKCLRDGLIFLIFLGICVAMNARERRTEKNLLPFWLFQFNFEFALQLELSRNRSVAYRTMMDIINV